MIHFSSQLTRAYFLWGCGFFPKTFFHLLQKITIRNTNNSNFLKSEKERGRRERREKTGALSYIAKEIRGYLERQFYELMRKYTRFFLCLCSIQSLRALLKLPCGSHYNTRAMPISNQKIFFCWDRFRFH